MKLSILLALSLLPLSCEKRIGLAHSGVTLQELVTRGASMARVKRMLRFLHEEQSLKVCFWGMEGYPSALYQMENPPFRLMYNKLLPDSASQLLTLCGTRYPDGNGAQRAYRFALEACANNTILVTSNSRGIDRTALYASQDLKANAFVICDCGLATHRIKAYHALPFVSLLSPYEPDDAAFPSRCLSRNMLSTAIGNATMVIQSPEKSGCLHCATSALDQGKDVFVHTDGLRGGSLDGGIASLARMGATDVASFRELAYLLCWESPCKVEERRGGAGTLYRFGRAWYSLEYA
ncbi:DNA-processing protein DprA [uncultured Sphaerochaeta sp.]|uniref:DNA-processing protein DprA n=1 Tax=uncultured Sphaerochaeta sp. TaxID=886478 RepID=UPI0029C9BD8B|nr:DNA-processing protein DprA [uncultured Sphaerochaeta sp.]